MISIRNVKKFLDDHPEFENKRQEIMEKARGLSDKGLIGGGAIEPIMGGLTKQFLQELMSSAHRQIGHEDIRKAIPDANIADCFPLLGGKQITFFPEEEN